VERPNDIAHMRDPESASNLMAALNVGDPAGLGVGRAQGGDAGGRHRWPVPGLPRRPPAGRVAGGDDVRCSWPCRTVWSPRPTRWRRAVRRPPMHVGFLFRAAEVAGVLDRL